jgi:methylmalonyl-CoA mutase
MDINDFAPNLSFFFSNGIDPEYSVIGRVARRIWAKAMKLKYGADERSQMLKYHIQTSGRSLHAQEIDFNDIRTTLQAFMQFMITVIHFTPMLMTKRLQRQPKNQ